jgi:hypothetical protein
MIEYLITVNGAATQDIATTAQEAMLAAKELKDARPSEIVDVWAHMVTIGARE